jgi:hypothetical protein
LADLAAATLAVFRAPVYRILGIVRAWREDRSRMHDTVRQDESCGVQ